MGQYSDRVIFQITLATCHMHHMGVMEPVIVAIQELVVMGVLMEAVAHMEVMG
jgi:hypothetical protein